MFTDNKTAHEPPTVYKLTMEVKLPMDLKKFANLCREFSDFIEETFGNQATEVTFGRDLMKDKTVFEFTVDPNVPTN